MILEWSKKMIKTKNIFERQHVESIIESPIGERNRVKWRWKWRMPNRLKSCHLDAGESTFNAFAAEFASFPNVGDSGDAT